VIEQYPPTQLSGWVFLLRERVWFCLRVGGPPESMAGMNAGITGRTFAACIAIAAWTGLIVQLWQSYSSSGSVVLALWTIFGFFTITTNVVVAFVFTWIALGRNVAEWIVAGTMLSIVLVGVVNALLLWGALELSGGSAVVDKLLHVVTPVLAPIFWIIFTPKGRLTWSHPLVWAIYPLAYLFYAIARGLATGRYAYPFLNIAALGWQRTALNAFYIAVGFMASGYAVVWIDRRFAEPRS
jgi:hypothetical protein